MTIHQTAIVSSKAKIADDVEIGAFCIVEDNVELAKGVKLHSHVVISGNTKIGEGTEIFPFAAIGKKPQDLKFGGEDSEIIIGKNNSIREYVTIHPGTKTGLMKTVIGDNCLLMVSCHIAHDCIIGNNVILANNATLAGHVTIGEFAIIGGLSAVRQFIRIGEHAMIGGMSGVENDVMPYAMAANERASLIGLNLVGLKRRSFDKDEISGLRRAYKDLFLTDNGSAANRVGSVSEKFKGNKMVERVIEFITEESVNSYCKPKR